MSNRRPIETRKARWAHRIAKFLRDQNITPNSISLSSIVFAFAAMLALMGKIYLLAAVLIQMRLLCNLFDGMVAIEFAQKTKSGEIFNDAPDRPADIFILLGAGYAIQSVPHAIELGWLAALLAVLTAYVRNLGVASGASPYFIGPMAKQHRMATITISAILAFFEMRHFTSDYALALGLVIVCIGSVFTLFRRLARIVSELESK